MKTTLCLFAVVCIATGCVSQKTRYNESRNDSVFAEQITKSRNIIQGLLKNFPGVSVSVVVDTVIVWSAGFGLSDIDNGIQATSKSTFRIYSLSKCLTATALLKLTEDGKIKLNSPIQQYIPYFPQNGSEITVRQVAGHTGGIRHYRGNEEAIGNTRCADLQSAVIAFAADSLMSTPGSKFLYSSYGYVLLSAVIEGGSNRTYGDYVSTTITKPLGMTSTVLEGMGEKNSNSKYYESGTLWGWKEARYVDNSCKWGAGAWVSSSEDLASFAIGLMAGKIIGKEYLGEMFSSMRTTKGDSTYYGFGFGVGIDKNGNRVANHSGSNIGGTAVIRILPDQKIAVIILANSEGPRLTDSAAKISELFARKIGTQ